MTEFNYDSYCGIYCGACDILMAYKTGVKHKLAGFWDESTVRLFQKKLGIHDHATRPYEIKCYGCRSDTLFTNCGICRIRECAIGKKVKHCIDCMEYPCADIKTFQKAVSLLPHLENNENNMKSIKKSGVKKWLAVQRDYWKCPECKTELSWYTTVCDKCGREPAGQTYKLTFLKSLILKLSIYLMPARRK